MEDYKIINGILHIPEGTTEIPKGAFEGNEEITGIVFPTSITKISNRAFDDCANLKEVDITAQTLFIEDSFKLCKSLQKIKISCRELTLGLVDNDLSRVFTCDDALETIFITADKVKLQGYFWKLNVKEIVIKTNHFITTNLAIAPECQWLKKLHVGTGEPLRIDIGSRLSGDWNYRIAHGLTDIRPVSLIPNYWGYSKDLEEYHWTINDNFLVKPLSRKEREKKWLKDYKEWLVMLSGHEETLRYCLYESTIKSYEYLQLYLPNAEQSACDVLDREEFLLMPEAVKQQLAEAGADTETFTVEERQFDDLDGRRVRQWTLHYCDITTVIYCVPGIHPAYNRYVIIPAMELVCHAVGYESSQMLNFNVGRMMFDMNEEVFWKAERARFMRSCMEETKAEMAEYGKELTLAPIPQKSIEKALNDGVKKGRWMYDVVKTVLTPWLKQIKNFLEYATQQELEDKLAAPNSSDNDLGFRTFRLRPFRVGNYVRENHPGIEIAKRFEERGIPLTCELLNSNGAANFSIGDETVKIYLHKYNKEYEHDFCLSAKFPWLYITVSHPISYQVIVRFLQAHYVKQVEEMVTMLIKEYDARLQQASPDYKQMVERYIDLAKQYEGKPLCNVFKFMRWHIRYLMVLPDYEVIADNALRIGIGGNVLEFNDLGRTYEYTLGSSRYRGYTGYLFHTTCQNLRWVSPWLDCYPFNADCTQFDYLITI